MSQLLNVPICHMGAVLSAAQRYAAGARLARGTRSPDTQRALCTVSVLATLGRTRGALPICPVCSGHRRQVPQVLTFGRGQVALQPETSTVNRADSQRTPEWNANTPLGEPKGVPPTGRLSEKGSCRTDVRPPSSTHCVGGQGKSVSHVTWQHSSQRPSTQVPIPFKHRL